LIALSASPFDRFYPKKKAASVHLKGGWVGPRAFFVFWGKEKSVSSTDDW
jgi:hypothetical protein